MPWSRRPRPPTAAPVAPAPTPTTPAPKLRPLRPPHAAPGQFAVVIQDPATWSTRQAAHLADRVQRSEVRPWRPPVRGPFLHHEAWRQADQLVCVPTGAGWLQAIQGTMGQYPDLDGRPQEPKGPGHLPLRRTLRAADAGPPEQAQRQEGQHRRSLQHHPGQTYKTLRQPTGAQVAIAWNCDAPPASSRRESLLPRGRGPYSRWSRATSA
jgi:hypothetical protein